MGVQNETPNGDETMNTKQIIKQCERRILICEVIQVIAAAVTVWGILNLWM